MPDDGVRAMDGELQRFERSRRRVYIVALLVIVCVALLAWGVRAPGDTYREWSAPIGVVALLALVVLLWRGRIALMRLELAMLLVLAALPLTRQVWLFHFAGPVDEQWLRLLGNNYWAVSALIVLLCTILERRRGIVAGAGIVLACALIAVTGLSAAGLRGGVETDTVIYVTGALLFLVLFLVLMSGATVMRDQWQGALVRADLYSRWAMTDRLTGLANRRAAEEALELGRVAAERHGRDLAVILGDLDLYKVINDSAGHAAGDAVLIAVAETLSAIVRGADTVARWGGEEFIVILPGADLEGAGRLAERCREAIEHAEPAGYRITMTFGVAQFVAGDDGRSLIARADANLYLGKAAERNRVEARRDPGRSQAAGSGWLRR